MQVGIIGRKPSPEGKTMRIWLALSSCALLAAAPQQKDAKDPDLLYQKDLGVSIRKPAKNDEWEFKDKGFFTNSKFVVVSKVDSVLLQIVMQEKSATGSFDPKQAAEGEWKNLSGSENFKDCKKVTEIKSTKIPNGGANNPMCYLLDMAMKDKADKPVELKMWCFIGKENQNLYKIIVFGDEGMYKKHQKVLETMLGSIVVYKASK
jgi:hypothetical protein